jgi:hypothetical protein
MAAAAAPAASVRLPPGGPKTVGDTTFLGDTAVADLTAWLNKYGVDTSGWGLHAQDAPLIWSLVLRQRDERSTLRS